ncbi:N-acetyltransferase family protein [Williamsia sp. MIQD14]|uniref:GNAT family N-acetyltransferase n=1 Tax=Williamsia sp. MIQD14 TaxID=3425703 RepID=UPI003D9FDD90
MHVDSWRETYVGLLAADTIATFDVAERAAMWTQALVTSPTPGMTTWLAEMDGEIVGFATSGPPRAERVRDIELRGLYTLARTHGTGLGGALLDAALGDRPAQLWVLAGNARALAFYRKHGFIEDGTTGVFDRWDADEVRMVR